MIRALLICSISLSAAPRIARAIVDVSTVDGHAYSVHMTIRTTDEIWPKPSHTLERVAGAHLLEIHATLDNKIETSGAVDRIVFSRPLPRSATYELTYSIALDQGHAIQVPLAVPEISTSGAARSIQIRVTPPAGSLLSGDAFPVFQQNATELANFPSHIEIEIGTRQRRSIPILLSDLGVVFLLAAGIFVRVMVRRRGPHERI